jgi:transposase
MPNTPARAAKLESLRTEGTLNGRPEDVRDELFQESEFFDSHDLVQVKYEMLRRVQKEKSPITEATAAFGLSRPSFYLAQTAFQKGGLGGLLPLKRGPKGAFKLTDEVLEFVKALLAGDPSLRTVELVEKVRERFALRVHRRTIERALIRSQKKRQTEK